MKTSLKNLLDKSNNTIYSFADEFNTIIEYKIDGYDGKTKDKLKSFFDDLQKGGCMSGIIGDFIYHSDCKDFYIKHIEDLEDFKEELEYQLGQPIQNRHKIVHYTFVVWLCFEEYCYDLYNVLFEN
jgi:hypothetical protein